MRSIVGTIALAAFAARLAVAAPEPVVTIYQTSEVPAGGQLMTVSPSSSSTDDDPNPVASVVTKVLAPSTQEPTQTQTQAPTSTQDPPSSSSPSSSSPPPPAKTKVPTSSAPAPSSSQSSSSAPPSSSSSSSSSSPQSSSPSSASSSSSSSTTANATATGDAFGSDDTWGDGPVATGTNILKTDPGFNCRAGAGYQATLANITVTIPYAYSGIVPHVSSFQQISWTGLQSFAVHGTDNQRGASRTYTVADTDYNETLIAYEPSSASQPLQIMVSLADTYLSQNNITFYSPSDLMTVMPACEGAATSFNFTAQLCSTDPTQAQAIYTMLHNGWVGSLNTLAGGQQYMGCAALGKTNSSGLITNGTGKNHDSSPQGRNGAGVVRSSVTLLVTPLVLLIGAWVLF